MHYEDEDERIKREEWERELIEAIEAVRKGRYEERDVEKPIKTNTPRNLDSITHRKHFTAWLVRSGFRAWVCDTPGERIPIVPRLLWAMNEDALQRGLALHKLTPTAIRLLEKAPTFDFEHIIVGIEDAEEVL